MAITPTNFFQYYSVLSKKRRLDDRESRIRSKEMMLSSQSVTSAPASEGDNFVNAQKFFEMGFRAGMRRAQEDLRKPEVLSNLLNLTGIRRREYGGPVLKGESYLVGESGPEVIEPTESGNVIPNQNIKDIVDNINQSVGVDRTKTRTIIQPQTTIETQFIPQQVPVPITRTVTVETMSKQKVNNTLARGIK